MKKYSDYYTDDVSYSSSKWESSYFGGYSRILYDHPDINVPIDFDWEFPYPDTSGLSYWNREQLIKMFLLKINSFGLAELLYAGSKEVEEELGYLIKRKKKFRVFSKEAVNMCLSCIIEQESELKKLFIHFKDYISNVTIKVEIKDKNKDEKESGEGKDGDKKESGKDKKSSLSFSDLNNLIEKIAVRKPYSQFEGEGQISSGDLKTKAVFKMMDSFPTPVKYSADQIRQAANIVRLLDISFDPKSDKIPSLKAGKLEISKISEIPAGNTNVYYRVEENQTTRPFSVCILCDESGSMDGQRLQYQNHLVKVLYKAFSDILPSDKIYIYGHSGSVSPEIRIYQDKYNPVFEQTIERQLRNNLSQNYDGPVIECIHEKVRSYTSDNIIFISISDGQPEGYDYGGKAAMVEMKKIIEKCRRDGFVTVGIGVKYDGVKNIYNYYTVVRDLNEMVKQVTTLINRVVKMEFKD